MIDFAQKRILVVGGTSGMGFATAKLAKLLGASVTIASRTAERIERATLELGGVEGVRLDVTDATAVEKFFSQSVWDHVVVTGSDVRIAAVRELPLDAARASFDSKFWGFYHVARAAKINPGGSLTVIAGFLATRPAAGRALMGAINGALESLVQGLALELKPIRVNAISPGMVETEMWNGMTAEAREAAFAKARAMYPAGCLGKPEDIARQILLLAATPFATGTVVTLDGGASIA